MTGERQLEENIFKSDDHIGRVIGLGVDIIETERVGRDSEENPLFAQEFCSPEEIAFCDEATGEERRIRVARKFSLKEAVIKALGGAGDTGEEPELDWREIIAREDGVDLKGTAKKRAGELGITSFSFIFTETKGVPIVVCVATGLPSNS